MFPLFLEESIPKGVDKDRKGRRREVVVFFSECVGKKRQAGKNKSSQAEGCETSDPKTLLTDPALDYKARFGIREDC